MGELVSGLIGGLDVASKLDVVGVVMLAAGSFCFALYKGWIVTGRLLREITESRDFWRARCATLEKGER